MEVELEQSLQEYRDQETLATAAAGSDEEELPRLLEDLRELVELTEGQLLDCKKAKLLQQIEVQNANFDSSTEIRQGQSSDAKLLAGPSSSADYAYADEDMDEEEGEGLQSHLDQLVGMRCRAPYGSEMGHQLPLKYHNAVILDVIYPPSLCLGTETSLEDLGDLKIRVVYCNPMYRAMQPCQYFLSGKCNFENSCRFSHGECVEFKELLEYEEPNFERLKPNSPCLTKSQEGILWERAVVTSVSREEGKVAVKFLHSGKEGALNFAEVLPLLPEHLSDTSSISTSSTDRNADATDPYSDISPRLNDIVDNNTETINLTNDLGDAEDPHYQASYSGGLGDWEKHTKGIGSRLMAKMGYVLGEGLGKESKGRLDPVEAKLVPKGKSLDYCMEAKKGTSTEKELRKLKRRKRRENLKAKKLSAAAVKNKTELGIFDFLNRKLTDSGKSCAKKAQSDNTGSKNKIKEHSNKRLNVKLLEIDNKRKKIVGNIKSLKTALSRNEGKDQVFARQIRAKISDAESELQRYDSHEQNVKQEQDFRNNKRKLTIF